MEFGKSFYTIFYTKRGFSPTSITLYSGKFIERMPGENESKRKNDSYSY